MDFEKTIKDLRKTKKITQEEMANKLNISRQAVSNWENGRNLPDIEILIAISRTFDISLDNLILVNDSINDITKKIISDGRKNVRAKMNLYSIVIGSILMLIGIIFTLIKLNSVEYVDSIGILHENFYLIPLAYLFVSSGFITILVSCIKYFKVK